jgi:hypothetical protein
VTCLHPRNTNYGKAEPLCNSDIHTVGFPCDVHPVMKKESIHIRELIREMGITFTDGVEMIYEEELYTFAEEVIKECARVNWCSPFKDGEHHARELLEYFEIKIKE